METDIIITAEISFRPL